MMLCLLFMGQNPTKCCVAVVFAKTLSLSQHFVPRLAKELLQCCSEELPF